ncbi:ErfK/YbiS/YcfS/YnhG [Cutibacterium acnes HL042PA3]|nr:ErfK/YbiS/YcfS/YnhG [Cutibacterium acnes HL042PA3]
MRSSRAASLVAALVMSLSAGVVGVANAEPTASPNPRQFSPAVTSSAPEIPANPTAVSSKEGPSVKASPSLASTSSPTESEAPSSPATPKPSKSIPASSMSSKPAVAPPATLPISKTGAHLDRRCMKGTVICASKKQRKLWMVHNGRILITLDARFGRASEPTAEGVHIIYWKDKNHVSSVYGSPMPYSMFFHRGQAIHYSSDFSRRGWNGASHGCINIRNMSGLKWLWNRTPTGRKVIVFK